MAQQQTAQRPSEAPAVAPVAFDAHAEAYDEALAHGLSVSGESANYFAEQRIAWLRTVLARLQFRPRHVLDFGCGTGLSVPHLLQIEGVAKVCATDPSERSLDVARSTHTDDRVEFIRWPDLATRRDFDLVFVNGVFHHIPPSARLDAVRDVRRCLRPGGLFALWDNNPWSPAARFVMSRIPFDKDVTLVWPSQARRWLRACGFTPVRTDFRFIFPRVLSPLRPLETALVRAPFGAQFQILSRADAGS